MPRPVKCRKVCHFPNVLEFLPADGTEKSTPIVLTVDEYETIRLLDKKGYSQEQCAASMQVARTTVQRIYEIARKKIADALIDGHPLRIEGGDFIICDGQSSNCSFGGCYKQEIYQKYAEEKGEGIMRIAVTYENGQIFHEAIGFRCLQNTFHNLFCQIVSFPENRTPDSTGNRTYTSFCFHLSLHLFVHRICKPIS